MAWQLTRRYQETLSVEQKKFAVGQRKAGLLTLSGQVRWAYHPPPWQRWLCVAVLAVLTVCSAVQARAQTDSAPFVFEGEVLRIDTPGWVSDAQYEVGETAYIDVAQGVDAHIRSDIKAAPGSPSGLHKLGAGTLRLSGAALYRGSTQLLQGGLHVDGPGVFQTWGGLEAFLGTQLEYSSGTEVSRPLTIRDDKFSDLPSVPYATPVAPPLGMEEVVGWRVDAGQAVHSGLLHGSGAFVKLGAGLLDISRDAMGYSGSAQIAEGALAINEIFRGSVQVQAGARLQGTGSVRAVHVRPGGVLAPGNSQDAWSFSGAGPGVFSLTGGGSDALPLTGDGLGTLRVTGDVQFEPHSIFQVRALATGEADFLQVGGKALLDGDVAVLAQNGLWNAATSYSILTAVGGLGEQPFASVATNLPFLTPSLSYSDHTVTLTLARNDVGLDDPGETPDEKEVGEVIDEDTPPVVPETPPKPEPAAPETEPETPSENKPEPGAQLPEADLAQTPEAPPALPPAELAEPAKANPDLHDRVAQLDHDSARLALRQLTGSWNASVLSSAWDDSRFVRQAVLRRAMAPGQPAAAVSERQMRTSESDGAARTVDRHDLSSDGLAALRPWVEAYHSEQRRDESGGVFADRRRLDGVVVGVAAAVNAYWHAGAFLGAQRSRLRRDEGMARADIESTHFGLYLATQVTGIRLAFGAARALHRLKSSSSVRAGTLHDALSARYGGHTTQVFGEVAANEQALPGLHRLALTPFARLAWVGSSLSGYTETGGSAALNVRPASMRGWLSTLGVRAETTFAPFGYSGHKTRVFGQAAWHYAGYSAVESTQAFRDSATQTAFTSQGLSPARQAWSLQLGLDARLGKASSIGIAYQGHFAPRIRDQGVAGWVRVAF